MNFVCKRRDRFKNSLHRHDGKITSIPSGEKIRMNGEDTSIILAIIDVSPPIDCSHGLLKGTLRNGICYH